MSGKPFFFAELKRRNVYKVAVAYAVVSWLLVHAASILFPTFDAPPWVMKVLVAVIVLGFPAALILSWAFEITPEGIRLESEITPNESIARKTGRKIVAITSVLAVIAVGLFVFQFIHGRSAITPLHAVSPARAEAVAPAPDKSIAVLPFESLSEEKSNAYFAEGVQDEILTRLAKVADLKVISRTSTQHFKSAPDNLPEIAQQLGVAHILEGSVQKAKDQVRVTKPEQRNDDQEFLLKRTGEHVPTRHCPGLVYFRHRADACLLERVAIAAGSGPRALLVSVGGIYAQRCAGRDHKLARSMGAPAY